jgi:two-component system sensor histidine kinase PhoQ
VKRLSLSSRLLFTVSLVLTIFLGFSALSLDKAFRASNDVAQQKQLKNYIYMLLTAADFTESGDIIMPSALAEPAFSTPSSGLYAQIINKKNTVWQSKSLLGLSLELPTDTKASEEKLTVIKHLKSDLMNLAYGIVWENAEGEEFEYTFNVTEDRSASKQEKASFRRSLWYWLGGTGLALLIIQALILRWGLKPLSDVAEDLSAIENGTENRLSKNYPAELSRLTHNINTLLDQEQNRQQRYKNALADLAHSIKTPLAVLRNELEMDTGLSALKSQSQTQLKKVTNLIDYQLQRAATEGPSALQAPIAIETIITKILASLNKVYQSKQVQYSSRIEPNLLMGANEGDMYELLGNLLENAYKYCQSQVITTITADDDTITITIEDDGKGIPAHAQSDILQRGKRFDTQTEGQGLGLAIASDIVDAYQGTIGLGPTQLGGACFVITLPQR